LGSFTKYLPWLPHFDSSFLHWSAKSYVILSVTMFLSPNLLHLFNNDVKSL